MDIEKRIKNHLSDVAATLHDKLGHIEPDAALEYAKKIIIFDSKINNLLIEYRGIMGLADKEIKMTLKRYDEPATRNAYGTFQRTGMIKTRKNSILIVTIYCSNWFYEGDKLVYLKEKGFGAHEIENIEVTG